MKAFFLRELAFLVAPAMLLTHFKELSSRFISVLVAAIFAFALMSALAVFILQPAGWAWLGVVFGFGVAIVLFLVVVSLGV